MNPEDKKALDGFASWLTLKEGIVDNLTKRFVERFFSTLPESPDWVFMQGRGTGDFAKLFIRSSLDKPRDGSIELLALCYWTMTEDLRAPGDSEPDRIQKLSPMLRAELGRFYDENADLFMEVTLGRMAS